MSSLADLEELCPSPSRPSPAVLFHKAIESARHYYNNHHVYPYVSLGSYHFRKANYKEALRNWAAAANVIAKWVQGMALKCYIDGLVQDCSDSSVLAMELLQSCAKPAIYSQVSLQRCLIL